MADMCLDITLEGLYNLPSFSETENSKVPETGLHSFVFANPAILGYFIVVLSLRVPMYLLGHSA